MEYNIKSIKQHFKEQGIYYTTNEMALYIKSLVDIEYKNVYDPTCGDGALLEVYGNEIKKYGQEINKEQIIKAEQKLKNFISYCGDTLKDNGFKKERFDLIVANPPFSIKWQAPKQIDLFTDNRFSQCPIVPPQSKADYAFNLHILYMLKDDGMAIVLNFPGVLYRGNREGEIRKWLIKKNFIETVIQIPKNMFVDTKISTCIIIYKKNKKTTDIKFIDVEKNKTRIVTQEEVKQNNYILSVSNYIIEEIKLEKIDAYELQIRARKQQILKLTADLQLDKLICELEGYNFQEYIEEIKQVINKFESHH